jgi:hypothetical protein
MTGKQWVKLVMLVVPSWALGAVTPAQGKDGPREVVERGKTVLVFEVSPHVRPQDEVIRFLTDDKAAFLKRLQERGPVFVYRFGAHLDDSPVVFAQGRAWSPAEWQKYQANPAPRAVSRGKPWGRADWKAWLEPTLKTGEDRRRLGAANLGVSLLDLYKREAGNLLAAVIVFSQGRSTEGPDRAFAELAELAKRSRAPLITVAPTPRKRTAPPVMIDGVALPRTVRPGDRFRVLVWAIDKGLSASKVEVCLDLYKPTANEPSQTLKKVVRFEPSSRGRAEVDFEVDLRTGKAAPPEGDWRVVARIGERASIPRTLSVSSRPIPAPKRINLIIPNARAGQPFEMQAAIKDRDGKPLPVTARPEVSLRLPTGVTEKDAPTRVTMKASRPGVFIARFTIHKPGEYGLALKVAETGDTLRDRFIVERTAAAADDLRPDLDRLYRLASRAEKYTSHLDRKSWYALRRTLDRVEKPVSRKDDSPHLFFDLAAAHLIPDCVVKIERRLKKR